MGDYSLLNNFSSVLLWRWQWPVLHAQLMSLQMDSGSGALSFSPGHVQTGAAVA